MSDDLPFAPPSVQQGSVPQDFVQPESSLRRSLRELFIRSPGGAKIAALDGARAIAVLVVVIHHAWLSRCGLFRHDCLPATTGEPLSVYALGLIVGHGDLGVDIFFVLSGYLIFSVLHRWFERPQRAVRETVRRFLLRRLLRIYPALVVMIPLNMLLFSIYPGAETGARAILDGCATYGWSNYLLVNNVAALGGSVLGIGAEDLGCAPWTWSVAVEWQFYLLSPFLVWRYAAVRARARERGRALEWWWGSGWVCVLFAAALAAGLVGVLELGLLAPGMPDAQMRGYMQWLYSNPLTRCTPYLIGMAAAAYRLHTDGREPGHVAPVSSWWLRGALATVAAFFILGVLPYYPWPALNLYLAVLGRTMFSAAVAVLLVVGANAGHSRFRSVRLLRHPVWYPLAQASYSVYLWQFVAIEAARWGFESVGLVPYQSVAIWSLFALIAVFLSFAIGAFSYMLIERPMMRARPAA